MKKNEGARSAANPAETPSVRHFTENGWFVLAWALFCLVALVGPLMWLTSRQP